MGHRCVIAVISLMVWSLSAQGQTENIYVRKNINPFESPYYIFSTSADGPSTSIELSKGSTYVFIRTDSGHPFNVGSDWRQADPALISRSTAPNETGYYSSSFVVSGVGSIQKGEELTVSIPDDFNGSSITYYCYSHSSMVSDISVVSSTKTEDSREDEMSDSGSEESSDAGEADNLDSSFMVDTDSDGFPDTDEVDLGSNPLDDQSTPPSGLNLVPLRVATGLEN